MLAPATFPPAAPWTDPTSIRRGLASALRWRALRVLPRLLPARTMEAARLVPVLLHASFQHGALRDEAPGVSLRRGR